MRNHLNLMMISARGAGVPGPCMQTMSCGARQAQSPHSAFHYKPLVLHQNHKVHSGLERVWVLAAPACCFCRFAEMIAYSPILRRELTLLRGIKTFGGQGDIEYRNCLAGKLQNRSPVLTLLLKTNGIFRLVPHRI